MKSANVYVSVLFLVCALVLTVWLGRGDTLNKADTRRSQPEQPIPVPSKTGPQPKAVTDETEYDFGVMKQGSKGRHVFVIRNEGKAPLEMVALKKDMTCQCTVGELGKEGLRPGESTDVTLSWTIKSPNPNYQHHAIVRTNDCG